jgi:hypothetical protein
VACVPGHQQMDGVLPAIPGILTKLIQDDAFLFFSRLFIAGTDLVGQRPSGMHI